MTWNRSREDPIELPIDALAILVLQDYVAGKGWNWQNWMRESEQSGTARDPEISLVLSEAWSWLMTQGLVVRDPSQSSADAYRISRLGHETLKYGVARLAAGQRLGERISAWWTIRSIMAAATTSSPKISPHPEKGLLEVTISEARS